MDDLQRLVIEHSCMRLMQAYCNRLDERDYDAFLAIYTPDGVWARVGAGGFELKGPKAILEFLAKRMPDIVSRHFCTNCEVEVIDADSARGLCFGLVVRGPRNDGGGVPTLRGVELIVEYRDTFVRTAAGWRIARREMTKVLEQPA